MAAGCVAQPVDGFGVVVFAAQLIGAAGKAELVVVQPAQIIHGRSRLALFWARHLRQTRFLMCKGVTFGCEDHAAGDRCALPLRNPHVPVLVRVVRLHQFQVNVELAVLHR